MTLDTISLAYIQGLCKFQEALLNEMKELSSDDPMYIKRKQEWAQIMELIFDRIEKRL